MAQLFWLTMSRVKQNYPTELKKDGDCWLVQKLRASGLNMGIYAGDLPAARIKIDRKHANSLKAYLKDRYQLTAATVYLDCTKLDC